MKVRGKYRSKHHDDLLSCLQSVPGKHFTVNEIYQELMARGLNIGTTTIYRQLNRLVEDGIVNKYTLDPNTPACYAYNQASETKRNEECYHCVCEVCGKLIHIQCEEVRELNSHMLREHLFKIDPMRTVFYGICNDCYMKA